MSVSERSNVASNLKGKFIIFCFLGFESSAHILPEQRESENVLLGKSMKSILLW